jgi:hypothetical protein
MTARQHIIGQLVDETPLDTLAKELATVYQQNLDAAGVNASGALRKAAPSWIFRWKGDVLMLTFRLPEEWWYVEHGRSPNNGTSGKRWDDPVGDILRWMEVKHLVPETRMRSARVPEAKKTIDPEKARRQMAQDIVHKIFRRGFYTQGKTDIGPHGKHPLEDAVTATAIKERLKGILVDAFGKEIVVELADMAEAVKPKA